MARIQRVVLIALCATACSSSSGGGTSGPVKGSVGGQSFSAADATGLAGQLTESTGTAYETDVVLTSWSGACSSLTANSAPPSSGIVFIAVAGAGPVGPGTYSISPGGAVRAGFVADDATCQVTMQDTAESGTVTYETVTSSSITGSVDAVFSSGSLQGTFTASVCGVSLATVTGYTGMSGTCQQ
jgi:hypothetical protein